MMVVMAMVQRNREQRSHEEMILGKDNLYVNRELRIHGS
jgi:hypothetical protein